LGSAPRKDKLRFVRAGAGTTVKLIPVNEVLWFEAEDKYITVATREATASFAARCGNCSNSWMRRFSGRFTAHGGQLGAHRARQAR